MHTRRFTRLTNAFSKKVAFRKGVAGENGRGSRMVREYSA
jgi:hypothetical protein